MAGHCWTLAHKPSSSLPTVLYFSSGSSYVLGQDDVLFIWQLRACSMRIKTQCCTDAINIYLYMQDYIHYIYTTSTKSGIKFFCSSSLHWMNCSKNTVKIKKDVLHVNKWSNVIYFCDQSWIFSIITPVFSVTWSSEIILICWFTAQETFLIISNVENSCAG